MASYVDGTGLGAVWGKFKEKLSGKRDIRRCTVYRGALNPQAASWYKFATINLNSISNHTSSIVFKVNGVHDSAQMHGILTAKIQTSTGGIFGRASLQWEYCNADMPVDDFVICYKMNTENSITAHLYCRSVTAYQDYHFTVLEEPSTGRGWAGIDSDGYGNIRWQLYDSGDPEAEIPAEYKQYKSYVVQTLETVNAIAPITEELQTKLPLTGGTLTGDLDLAKSRVKLTHTIDERTTELVAGTLKHNASPGNSANGMSFYNWGETTTAAQMGVYNRDGAFSYMYVGGTYNDPTLKITNSLVTSKLPITAPNLLDTGWVTMENNTTRVSAGVIEYRSCGKVFAVRGTGVKLASALATTAPAPQHLASTAFDLTGVTCSGMGRTYTGGMVYLDATRYSSSNLLNAFAMGESVPAGATMDFIITGFLD